MLYEINELTGALEVLRDAPFVNRFVVHVMLDGRLILWDPRILCSSREWSKDLAIHPGCSPGSYPVIPRSSLCSNDS